MEWLLLTLALSVHMSCSSGERDTADVAFGEVAWAADDAVDAAREAWLAARWRRGDIVLRFADGSISSVELRNRGDAPVDLHGYRVAPLLDGEALDLEAAVPAPAPLMMPGGRVVVDVAAFPSDEDVALVAPDRSIVLILERRAAARSP